MAEAVHEILGGKVQLFRRPRSSYWQCRASVGGAQLRHSTKTESLAQAKDVAEDWFLTLKGKAARGELTTGPTFADAAKRFMTEFKVITAGQRSPDYVRRHQERLDLYLLPFFGNKAIGQITSGLIQDYRVDRITQGGIDRNTKERNGKPPSRSTMHQEMVCLRQVLKCANRHGWLSAMPLMSDPYRASGKISHRAWFSPAEYKTLYEATRERAKNPDHSGARKFRTTIHPSRSYEASSA